MLRSGSATVRAVNNVDPPGGKATRSVTARSGDRAVDTEPTCIYVVLGRKLSYLAFHKYGDGFSIPLPSVERGG
jgi:hypothetical protein